ncbi:MAG: nodulation protein NfeD [Elusimicrobia bacterium]|nr:nodulation protein NfeD [Elusimicrobiota bacterium]
MRKKMILSPVLIIALGGFLFAARPEASPPHVAGVAGPVKAQPKPAAKAVKEPAAPLKIYEIHNVLAAPYSGVITPAAAEFINQAIDKATNERFDLAVIQLDTPGGLDGSMREIIKKILASKVPVAVYVYPQGARAASAGVFIAMASHIVAMSPGTNIGAAHPVVLGALPSILKEKEKEGKQKDPLEDKILNDASAYIKSITQKSKRNVEWAIKAVTKSDSISAEEALSAGVADIIAADMNGFFAQINGLELADFGKIKTTAPRVETLAQTRRQKFLAVITDPNIAMILMSLGAAGLFIELYNPGLILPGVVGAVALVLGFYSFQTLSANFAGILLILLGFVFFIVEIKVLSYGLLTLAGAASVILGALMLFNAPSLGGLSISMNILGSTLITLVAVVAALAWIVIKAQMRKVVTGIESLVHKKGLAKTALSPRGAVLVEGELWNAESVAGDLSAGTEVVVQAVDGFRIKVRRA